jgi:hypothetical protein
MSKPDKTQVDWPEARRVAAASIAMATQILAAVNESASSPLLPSLHATKKNLPTVQRSRRPSVRQAKPD